MMRTIRVTGKGQIKVHPDMTRITMTLEGKYKEYADALRHSSEDTEALKDVLAPFGFERSDLKTLNFSIDTEYEHYEAKGVYKQRFAGYKFWHTLKVEFESDNDRLGKILYALAGSPVKPEFRLSYTVKDPEAVKNALLGKAVSDAKEKADVLTRAAGLVLKDIQTIDYSWGEMDLEFQPMSRNLLMAKSESMEIGSAGYDMDMEPDDIDVSDTVTVVWEIE
ncbi:MAG: SIMPL domain-containing protein [Lachnospiraceae bacterium]|nr:SIMPL domain-containing protein [Lachnospiraceae bacterium]